MLAYTVAFAGVGHYYDWWGLDWVVRGYPKDSPEHLIRQELRDEKAGQAFMRRDHMGLELNTDAVKAGDDAKMRLHFDKYQEEHRQAVAEKVSKIINTIFFVRNAFFRMNELVRFEFLAFVTEPCKNSLKANGAKSPFKLIITNIYYAK